VLTLCYSQILEQDGLRNSNGVQHLATLAVSGCQRPTLGRTGYKVEKAFMSAVRPPPKGTPPTINTLEIE
jgi:hypothetical protein